MRIFDYVNYVPLRVDNRFTAIRLMGGTLPAGLDARTARPRGVRVTVYSQQTPAFPGQQPFSFH